MFFILFNKTCVKNKEKHKLEITEFKADLCCTLYEVITHCHCYYRGIKAIGEGVGHFFLQKLTLAFI